MVLISKRMQHDPVTVKKFEEID